MAPPFLCPPRILMHPLSRLALVFLVACLGQPALADDLAEASAFISDLYRGYEGQGQRPKRGDPRWYDVSLIRLLTENEKANSDAVPFVSGDPLCNCMEVSGLKVGEVKAMRDEGGRLAGEAKLQFPGDRLERIRLTLIRTPDGLRIWDLADNEMPSLRKALADDTAAALKDKAESGRK